MTYPVTSSAHALAVSATLIVPFQPTQAGLVTVVAVASGIAPQPQKTPPSQPNQPARPAAVVSTHPAPPFDVELRIDVSKPSAAAPAGEASGTLHYVPGTTAVNRIVVVASATAGAGDLGGEWQAVITNTGTSALNVDVTVRYQTMAGNLGKVDHVVVMMMENRSFDHMLGYLKLAGRTDVDGLDASMSNQDEQGVVQHVFALADDGRPPSQATYFKSDPDHGWGSVDQQLGVHHGPATPLLPPNGGFVVNFHNQLLKEAQQFGPTYATLRDEAVIDSLGWRALTFRPQNPGQITVFTTPTQPSHGSENNLLAEIVLEIPGAAQPITTQTPLAQPSAALQYTATAADLSTPGLWTVRIKNWTQTAIDFKSTVTYVELVHDTSNQETSKAVMGYYDHRGVPTYDFIATNFAICDRWFAALPTDTFPNRLYAMAGGSEGLQTTPPTSHVIQQPPAYMRTTIFEVLQQHGVEWNIFFNDMPFALLYKRFAQQATLNSRARGFSEFLRRAEIGDLPALTWIDPKFSDVEQSLGERELGSDDHPEGDISRGQHLAWQVYDALSHSPAWQKTLFIIFYDEHGGFYDHVRPPGTPIPPLTTPAADGPPDDDTTMTRYGVRVPGLLVSPWIAPESVDHTVHDHTSVLATVLQRFCPDAVATMGKRAAAAQTFEAILSEDAPRAPVVAPEPTMAAPFARLNPVEPDAFGVVLRTSVFGF
jgi:phospholipase C